MPRGGLRTGRQDRHGDKSQRQSKVSDPGEVQLNSSWQIISGLARPDVPKMCATGSTRAAVPPLNRVHVTVTASSLHTLAVALAAAVSLTGIRPVSQWKHHGHAGVMTVTLT